jgi:DnaJ-class molecular chaperone
MAMASETEGGASGNSRDELGHRGTGVMNAPVTPEWTSFVPCDACGGSGVWVEANGYWPDGSENNIEHPCPECDGTGTRETAVDPVTQDDLGRASA